VCGKRKRKKERERKDFTFQTRGGSRPNDGEMCPTRYGHERHKEQAKKKTNFKNKRDSLKKLFSSPSKKKERGSD
jgi:hypothetical protein